MSEKRSLRLYLREVLIIDELPERTARTFGFGVFIGFSPFIGFHTLIAIGVMMLVRLNRLAFLAGVFLNTAWTVAPALALGTALGIFVLGSDAAIPEMSRETLGSGQFWGELASDAWNLLLPFFLGNFILSAVCALAGYWILKRILLRRKKNLSPLRGEGGEPSSPG